jgi:hypothetical protein
MTTESPKEGRLSILGIKYKIRVIFHFWKKETKTWLEFLRIFPFIALNKIYVPCCDYLQTTGYDITKFFLSAKSTKEISISF